MVSIVWTIQYGTDTFEYQEEEAVDRLTDRRESMFPYLGLATPQRWGIDHESTYELKRERSMVENKHLILNLIDDDRRDPSDFAIP